jgi:MFS family permease
MVRNVALYPWFKFCQNLLFWQAIWFLYFQSELSAAQALVLYVAYDVATTVLEVPSGYMSDRLGRRKTLIAATIAGALGAGLIALGDGFAVFVIAQVCLGAAASFASGTENALLYESLKAAGREDEIEAQETRGWRFTLTALALSAFTGGVLALISYPLAFGAGALAMCVALRIAWQFTEPPHEFAEAQHGLRDQWRLFRTAMGLPVLVWLFVLSVLMYGFSHVPFVFGQPFIAEALGNVGWQAEAPLVSGSVSALMMLVSVAATLVAVRLRRRIGLPAILVLAFGIQIGLIAVLAMTNSMLAIAVLFLRMVPNSLSGPFIIARIQPLLSDSGRATFLSIQSFAGRLLFASTLLIASARTSGEGSMAYSDIRVSLAWYAIAGTVFLAVLWMTVRRARVDVEPGR